MIELADADAMVDHLDRVHGIDPNTVEHGSELSLMERECDCKGLTDDQRRELRSMVRVTRGRSKTAEQELAEWSDDR